jgi:Mg/Co/Ni transporter MgtE
MDARETPQARRAALLLHSLAVGERRRVLTRLTAAEAAMLGPLLDELKELGVSPSLGRQLQAEAHAPQREAAAEQTQAALNPEQIARLLESCDALTVSQLLRARSWPWEAQVLESMPSARKSEVLSMRSELASLGPAAQRALCDCFEQRGSQPRPTVRHPAAAGAADLTVNPFESGAWSAVRRGFRRMMSWIR